ncbi:ankyrin repeat domain-containing protein [Variovorax paradoxus]|uniref:ankyrin repeat domain-containing protein n=1 Tax=Variovorax paradoxus TaxID=34073 RepID=UPI003D64F619
MSFDRDLDKAMARAIEEGDVRTMRRLFEKNEVSPHTVGRDATGWLVIAVAARQKEALDLLLEVGALGNPRGKSAGQALYVATLNGDLYWLRRLYVAGADLNNYGGGDLLLEVAIDTRNKATLNFYLDAGVDLNKPTSVGGSVALSTAQARRFDLVNRLLDLGASPWVIDAYGATLGLTAERAARVPAWDTRSSMEQERRRLLMRLHSIGFPNPAPSADEAWHLAKVGHWPPKAAGSTAHQMALPR